MMDFGTKPADVRLADMDVEGASSDSPGAPPRGGMPRTKSHMSIFGPDLVYQRDAKRRLEIDKLEAEEREAEELREAEAWEKDRLKQEKKKSKSKKFKELEVLAAQRKLEGRSPSRMGLNADATGKRSVPKIFFKLPSSHM